MAATIRLSRIELSAGGVIYRQTRDAGLQVLLIKDSYGNWGFPKGHVEAGEDAAEAALRECQEETGLTRLRLGGPLGTTDWYFRSGTTLVHKFCDYYLVEAAAEDRTQPQQGEGIQACEWFNPAESLERITYANARAIAQLALQRAGHGSANAPDAGRADVSADRRRGK